VFSLGSSYSVEAIEVVVVAVGVVVVAVVRVEVFSIKLRITDE